MVFYNINIYSERFLALAAIVLTKMGYSYRAYRSAREANTISVDTIDGEFWLWMSSKQWDDDLYEVPYFNKTK